MDISNHIKGTDSHFRLKFQKKPKLDTKTPTSLSVYIWLQGQEVNKRVH